MRFLIVLISLLFSFIFFLFYTSGIGKNILFQQSDFIFYGNSVLGNLIYNPLIFLLITIFFFFLLKNKKINIEKIRENNEKIEQEKIKNNQELNTQDYKLKYFIPGILIFYSTIFILFFIFNINYRLFIFIFILGIGIYFVGKYLFFHKKINKKLYIYLNIYSIISSYILSVIGILYTIFSNNNIIFSGLLLLIGVFNIYIHLRYNNIVSLLFGIITFIYILYRGIVYLFPGII